MPKMKTHSGAKKRFRITGSGKVMHRKAGKMHLNEHKPSTRTRRLDGDAVLTKGDAKTAKKLLGK
ncbi:50S ribosomal protein L35 [Naumannella halotolerans]|uniref:Large ribosomal subunit protein bL35 n=1 Tax=Naumannella halotolerans TaxID=993414 RepID=A0A4R7J934_9ACTN|nr:50S ribosomal protein L35 [Naumannella halotolerans]TDT33077.1 large subunit ribosomal protein L35 [Naumannella halotolerans]